MAHLTDAKAYLAAAILLAPHEGANLAIYSPILFLLSHAIELALKAFILAAGGTRRQLRLQQVRHNLLRLSKKASELGCDLVRDDVEIAEIIGILHPFHAEHRFRYRQSGYAKYPAASEVISAVKKLVAAIEPTVWKSVFK
jgi:hypothetical protein